VVCALASLVATVSERFEFPEWMRCGNCRWWVEPSAELLEGFPEFKGRMRDAAGRPVFHCRRYPTIVERHPDDICGEFVRAIPPHVREPCALKREEVLCCTPPNMCSSCLRQYARLRAELLANFRLVAPVTFEQIGQAARLSRERVRQIIMLELQRRGLDPDSNYSNILREDSA
jgi:hypothetical protein